MSGDSFSLNLPLSRFADESCEATALYRELRIPLLRYLNALGLTTDEALDVVQEAFLSLHKQLTVGGSQENIRSWVFRVAHNRARNFQQSYAQRLREPLDPVFDSFSREATPDQVLMAEEKFSRLNKAIRTLEAQERECLMLRAEGLRYREIGEVIGIATSTVADTVERAVRKLAEKCNV